MSPRGGPVLLILCLYKNKNKLVFVILRTKISFLNKINYLMQL